MDDKKPGLAERKERAAVEGRKALLDYQANDIAVRKNMERLKQLRLEKEAADRAEALANPPPPPVKKVSKAKKKVPAEKASDEKASAE
jgi:hypothetical protein